MRKIFRKLSHGGNHILLSALIAFVALLTGGATVSATEQGYAVFDSNKHTLTFKYGEMPNNSSLATNGVCELNSEEVGKGNPEWITGKITVDGKERNVNEEIYSVIFDETFKNCHPETCAYWFYGMTNLIKINGIENLNTDQAQSMAGMFQNCKSLKYLDISNLTCETANSLARMFNGCTNLKMIDISGFKTYTDKNYDYLAMFMDCTNLTTILTNGEFNPSKEGAMFQGCTSLVADDGNYFTYKGTPYVLLDGNTLTFGCTKKGESVPEGNLGFGIVSDSSLPWNHNYTIKVVRFDKSFKAYLPTSCKGWLSYLTLDKIEGLENLDTHLVTDMTSMFSNCTIDELDLSTFDTENVTTMIHMFFLAPISKIDISNFNMENVTSAGNMFYPASRKTSVKIGDFKAPGEGFAVDFGSATVRFYTPLDKYASNKANDTENQFSDKLRVYIPASTTASYGTFCLPMGSDLTAGEFSGFDNIYTAPGTSDDNKGVVLTKADKIEPGVAYVFHRNQADDDVYNDAITFNPNSDTEATEPNNDNSLLKGTFTKTTAPVGSYVLQTDGKFHKVGSTKTINVSPYKAYLQLPSTQSASTLSIVFDGGATSINGIIDNGDNNDAPVYDLSGRRIDTMVKGNIYVKNGKKFMF